jgi:hypothetical protein
MKLKTQERIHITLCLQFRPQYISATVKRAYDLCAGPLINPEPHVANAVVFPPCDKQSLARSCYLVHKNATVSFKLERVPLRDTCVKGVRKVKEK